jgi:hypothetical protein
MARPPKPPMTAPAIVPPDMLVFDTVPALGVDDEDELVMAAEVCSDADCEATELGAGEPWAVDAKEFRVIDLSADDDAAATRPTVKLPHCSSRALVHSNCAAKFEPVAFMHESNQNRHICPGTLKRYGAKRALS